MITVYTKNNCPNCVQAKSILKIKGREFEEVNVDEDSTARDYLISLGFKTMPQIYIKDSFEWIPNGHLGLLRLMREGKL